MDLDFGESSYVYGRDEMDHEDSWVGWGRELQAIDDEEGI